METTAPTPSRFAALRTSLPIYAVAATVIAISVGFRVWFLHYRGFEADEFANLHGGWSVANGLLPYRDFYETHPPGIFYLLVPLYRLLGANPTAATAARLMFAARWLMWVLGLAIFALTFWIGKRWRDAKVGAIAAAFLTTTYVVHQKILEIRSDVPATVFLLAGVLLALGGVAGEGTSDRRTHSRLLLSGVMIGAVMLFTQKPIAVVPGIAAAIIWGSRTESHDRRWRPGLVRMAWFSAGFAIPIALMSIYFLVHSDLGNLVWDVLIVPSRWKTLTHASFFVRTFASENPVVLVLGSLVCAETLVRLVRGHAAGRADIFVAFPMASLIAGYFLVSRSLYFQYYLYFLPFMALFAADGLIRLSEWSLRTIPQHRRHWADAYALALAAIVVWVTWSRLRLGFHTGVGEFALFSIGALAVMWVSARVGASRGIAVGAAAAVLTIVPLYRELNFDRTDNVQQVARLQYVLNSSTLADTVLDGYTGVGVFRPNATYYGWMTNELAPLVPAEDRSAYIEGLKDGALRPKFIGLDYHLQALLGMNDLSPYGYVHTFDPDLWIRR